MIRSFGDRLTEGLYHGETSAALRRLPGSLAKAAVRKLDAMEGAVNLGDLRFSPGNRLEALSGDLKGWHSIRVNDQWRLIFRWHENGADDVRLVDHH